MRRRMKFAVLTVAAVVLTCLSATSAAMAQAPVVIDAVDSPQPAWQPPNVTVGTGEVVRWEFDQATSFHTLTSTSSNWSVNESRSPGGAAIERSFSEPGTYTFVCQAHPGQMTGSVTVEADEPPADQLENVLVFYEVAGFAHTSRDEGLAAIEQLGADNDFNVDSTADSTGFFTDASLAQYDAVVWLSTTGNVLDEDEQRAFERYVQSGGGYAGIHSAADTEYDWAWYGELLGGAYFDSHPANQDATVRVEDGDEPSTQHLPAAWVRHDEWYNYRANPREAGVKVLATLDESTYTGGNMGDDHPIAWCTDFDGGRAWYTGGGHTEASYAEPAFMQHVLGGIRTAARDVPADCGDPRQSTPREFEKVTLDDDTQNPMELDIAPDGRVFYIERTGEVNIYKPDTQATVVAGNIPVYLGEENGLIGLALAPDFETSGWVYLAYSLLPESTNTQVVARYKVVGDQLDMTSRQEVFTWTHQRETCCHSSGSLYFGPTGDLYISTGDNTNPFESDGFAPIDERPGREPFDAQRTSANTNDLNGKILRITPNATTPGYTVPAGNLFAPGTPDTRSEIYAMGFRNPFRFTVDPETEWVLMADYGPDAGATVANRGPQGSVEYNAVTSPGNYGWPYCIRENVPYNDYNFATGTSGPKFDCANPTNNSPNNTGQANPPTSRPATMWMGYTEADTRFPELGTGGAPMSGPRYHFDPDNPSDTKFPEAYDGEWFIAEWNNDWIKTATLDAEGNATDVDPFPSLGPDGYHRPMDLDFGPDGSLYIIEWGSGFGGNNADSGVYRIDYVAGERAPIARATATPDNGSAPLTVQFSSEGSVDPEGTPLTYAWDFDGNGSTDSTAPNPSHQYDDEGAYNARLTVTDGSGKTAVDNVQVVVGNNRPEVTIEIPEEGTFVDYGDTVPYEITVQDQEDTTPNCDDVVLQSYLGHNTHAHPLRQYTGCQGTFETLSASGHGPNENIFPLIEATYTDTGLAGGGGRLSGVDQHILQPKRKQAEFFTNTGRAADGRGGGTPGVQTEQTTDSGGGQNIGFIEDGDYVSFSPMNFHQINALVFRVASGGDGGNVEVRLDSPTGQLVATSPTIANTGGWQAWQDVRVPITDPGGTHEVFFVFRHPTSTGGLMNLNWIEAEGRGAATNARPKVTASADPEVGTAPLTVQFDGEARDTDAEPGDTLTYEWDFGDGSTSTEEDPSHTYTAPGRYDATLTVTDALGAEATDTVEVRVTPSSECPQNNIRSDEFDGSTLDPKWEVVRPDNTRPPTVSGGELHFPIDNGSIYGPGTSARNIVVQPLPDGDVSVTAKLRVDALTQNYQQAGLRVYSDDNNWASVHMISANGARDFEFIWESNGNPRNEGADKLGGIPADAPLEYYVRLVSDGEQLTAFYSYDGETFQPVGRPASLATFTNPRIGPVALSDQASEYPVAHFDWVRFDPDSPPGGGGGGGEIFADDFGGTDLGAGWEVVRRNQDLQVSGGALRIPAAPGDIYGGRNDAANLVMRDAPDGEWVATAKVNFEGTAPYQQAGLLLYGDDANFTKFGRIAHTAAGDEKFEFIYESAGNPRNEAADSTPNIPAAFPDDFWVRMTSDGTNVTGAYSTDGSAWTPVGRPAPLPANAKIGMFAFSNDATGNPEAAFDSFALTGPGGGGPSGPSRDDQFDGSTLDKERWNAIVREDDTSYDVAGGELTITTQAGDIYTGSNSNPRNFILQSADHAGQDWVIETKLSGTINGGYGQGGLIAYGDDDNYVKLDPISDAGNTRINRIELRSEVAGNPVGPEGQQDPEVPAGTSDIWVRLTKSGTTYSGEYSFDGATWTPMGSVTNAMAAPDFGLFAFGPQADGQGDTVSFDYFTLDGADEDPCECVPGPGDEFDGSSLDKGKWNAIVREDDSLYEVSGGALRVTTVGGDIYGGSDPAPTRNFILQDAPAGDWVIETKVSGDLSGGYEQAGLMAYQDDANYIKYDLISDDGQTVKNRIELRTEEANAVQDPQPQVSSLNVDAAWLRLTKTGDIYTGEYSLDGETWQSIGEPVQNDMAAPKIGLFTLGVNSPGGTAVFDHFAVNGSTGCPEPPPANEAPDIESVTADPTIGFGPLEVDFTTTATDADGDALTYSWDFDGDGTADSTAEDPTYTYTEPGVYDAEVTVSDGTAERSDSVRVQVLPEDDADDRFRVLVFSRTAGFRHSSIDEGHAAIEQLGTEHDFQVDSTEDPTAFRAGILDHYDTVTFLSTTGDVLNDTQQAAFEDYVQGGGGYAGIHAASDTEYGWNWYGRLVGAYFMSHPQNQEATVRVEDREHPSTAGLPDSYSRLDEWYNFRSPDFADPNVPDGDYSPRGQVHVLENIDEASYDEQDGNATDDDHPLTWCQRYDGGRSWYTAQGHVEESFDRENEDNILDQILGGLETTAGVTPSESCGVSETDPGSPTVQAFADPQTGSVPLRVRFSATGLDPDGGRLTYKWDFGDGGMSFERAPRHTYTEVGEYTATVTATDQEGKTGTDEVEITVTDSAAPTVTATADPQSGAAPLRVRFAATADDPDGPESQITYAWEFGDGGEAFGRRASHRYMEPGTYTATVTATDAEGATGTDSIEIVVTNPPGNRAPNVEAAADPQSGQAPLRVRFSTLATDPDGDRLTYAWDFGDGGTSDRRNVTHTFTEPGTYTATVTVSDPGGETDSAELEIEVLNAAPTVRAAADPDSGAAPLRVRFTSEGSDRNRDQLSYVWDFGDGTQAGGRNAVHTYRTPGTYTAEVTVADRHGATGTAEVPVTVTAAAAPLSAAGGGAPLPSPSAQGGDVAGESETSGLRVRSLERRVDVRRLIRRGLRYRVACEQACRVSSVLKVSGRRLGRSTARSIDAGESRRVVVRLGRRVRTNLIAAMKAADLRRVRATVVTRIETDDGTRRLRQRVTLRL